MRRYRRRERALIERYRSTCGWCKKEIPPNTPVIGGGIRVPPGMDLTDRAGQVVPLHLAGLDRTVLTVVPGPDSEARQAGHDLVVMACSEACGFCLLAALRAEFAQSNDAGLEEP